MTPKSFVCLLEPFEKFLVSVVEMALLANDTSCMN